MSLTKVQYTRSPEDEVYECVLDTRKLETQQEIFHEVQQGFGWLSSLFLEVYVGRGGLEDLMERFGESLHLCVVMVHTTATL